MQVLFALSALVSVSMGMVCPPNACENVQKPLLNCLGGTVRGSGWCGCTDSCAILEGEDCKEPIWGIPNEYQCDEGLVCKSINLEGTMSKSLCINATMADLFVSKRFVCPDDACDNVEQEDLNCAGTIVSTGVCGCTKTCAKQKGESCQLPNLLSSFVGIATVQEKCEDGLICSVLDSNGKAITPTCMEQADTEVKRSGLMVCPDNACVNVEKKDLACKGGLLEGAGWCGCTDACAKVHGEECVADNSPFLLLGATNEARCDDGLICHQALEGKAICLKPEEADTFVSKRSTCETPCQKKSQLCTFSFVIYQGQWFAQCDTLGNFLPQQCDNQGKCFCVDELGNVDESSKVYGSANCA